LPAVARSSSLQFNTSVGPRVTATGARNLALAKDPERLSLFSSSLRIESLPASVRTVVEQLVATESTQSIWLVGSRANDDANEGSDWDLLMFSKNEPQETARKRSPGVDVIHVGPSGACLLEGQTRSSLRDFRNWQWREESTCAATYVSNDFLDADQEPVITDRPFQPRRTPKRASLLWSRPESL